MRIETVYDIGAHRGEWTRKVRARLPDAEFVLFEANEVHAQALEESAERFFIAVLSSEEKLVKFYGSGGPGDSYFREAAGGHDGVTPRSIRAERLDDLIETHGLPLPDFIKTDVQGAELDVLQGGRAALTNASLVLLECPIVEYNEGAPTIHDYFRFMEEHEFTPIDVVEWHWRGGRTVQVDVLFGGIAAIEGLLP